MTISFPKLFMISSQTLNEICNTPNLHYWFLHIEKKLMSFARAYTVSADKDVISIIVLVPLAQSVPPFPVRY